LKARLFKIENVEHFDYVFNKYRYEYGLNVNVERNTKVFFEDGKRNIVGEGVVKKFSKSGKERKIELSKPLTWQYPKSVPINDVDSKLKHGDPIPKETADLIIFLALKNAIVDVANKTKN